MQPTFPAWFVYRITLDYHNSVEYLFLEMCFELRIKRQNNIIEWHSIFDGHSLGWYVPLIWNSVVYLWVGCHCPSPDNRP